jgi:hypothetical protein
MTFGWMITHRDKIKFTHWTQLMTMAIESQKLP